MGRRESFCDEQDGQDPTVLGPGERPFESAVSYGWLPGVGQGSSFGIFLEEDGAGDTVFLLQPPSVAAGEA